MTFKRAPIYHLVFSNVTQSGDLGPKFIGPLDLGPPALLSDYTESPENSHKQLLISHDRFLMIQLRFIVFNS